MSLLLPDELALRDTGSLKWTGILTPNGMPTKGAWVAEMDFGTAPEVRDLLVRAVNEGMLGYNPPWLTDAVREATCTFQERRFGWVVEPSQVRIASSVLGALEATITQLTRPGSSVVVPTPAYMPFLTIPEKLGRKAVQVPSLPGWKLDLQGIRAALEDGAGLVMLCNPWNPTGRVFTVAELKELHDLVSEYDALVFADEIHSPLVYGDASKFVSYASLGPTYAAHTVTAVAASKGWNIAGLPAAQVILPDNQLRDRWDRKAAPFTHGATTFGLLGAATAYTLDDAWLDEVLAYISKNLDLADKALAGTSIEYSRPEATYLTWWGWDRPDPAATLRKAGVGVNAGITLGANYGNWARVNAAMPRPLWEETLELAVAALRP